MNPGGWEDALWRLQGNQEPEDQAAVRSSTANVPGADHSWHTYCQYSRYTVDEPRDELPGVDLGPETLSPPSHDLYIKESCVEDPDGEPLQMDKEDPELVRKRQELREIEEQIMHKKVAIALKTVKPGFSSAMSCNGLTLRDRVNLILQQRHPVSFPPKVQKSSSLRKDGLLQEDHPLKLRVKALMKQRCSAPCVSPANNKLPDVTLPPPCRSVPSPSTEVNSINQGFQRFLSVLNKGVDMDLLSRIVNDDSEDPPQGEELLNIQPPAIEDESDRPFRSQSQRSNSGASLLDHRQTNSGDRKTHPPRQERSLSGHLPDDDGDKKNARGELCFGSRSRSKSPPAVKKKKKEEEEKPKVVEQREQLQNILNTLGLSLEVEEISELTTRTQERLYGKKHEGMRADSKREQERQQGGSHRLHRSSSSSSSSSCSASSRSSSGSISPSPSRSRDSRQRRTPESSSSRDESRDRLMCRGTDQDREDTQRHRDHDFKETSAYQHAYVQNQPNPHPAALSAFPDYSLSQYSLYDAYPSGSYSAATDSYWSYTQGAIPPSPYPNGHHYPQNTYHHFPSSVVANKPVNPHYKPSKDVDLLMNPDLSECEGQIGSASGPRCLRVISIKQTNNSLKKLTKHRRKNKRVKKRRCRRQRALAKRAAANQAVASWSVESGKKVEDKGVSNAEAGRSEEEERKPTEEEIKANLRIKLEAFNQKAKQKQPQPVSPLTCQTD